MLLLKIDYTKLQKRIITSVFSAVFLITLPHLLGYTKIYHSGSHSITGPCHRRNKICDLLSHIESADKEVPWTVLQCGSFSDKQTLSTSEALRLEHIPQLLDTWCNSTTESNSSVCKPVHTPADTFTPHLIAGLSFSETKGSNGTWGIRRLFLSVCNSTPTSMRHDPHFVKAVYLGIDLPLRYIIPCLALVAFNIRLLVAVYQAQKLHKQIIGDTSPVFLLDLPVLKSVGALLFWCLLSLSQEVWACTLLMQSVLSTARR